MKSLLERICRKIITGKVLDKKYFLIHPAFEDKNIIYKIKDVKTGKVCNIETARWYLDKGSADSIETGNIIKAVITRKLSPYDNLNSLVGGRGFFTQYLVGYTKIKQEEK